MTSTRRPDVSLFLRDLEGGGAERVMLNIATGMSARGHSVDLVLVEASGAFLRDVPREVRVVELGTRRTARSVRALARYVRSSGTPSVISALHHANLALLIAKKLYRLPVRAVPTVHNTLSVERDHARSLKVRLQHVFMRIGYRWADRIVAVSDATARDFTRSTGIGGERVVSIYNPVITDEIFAKSREPVDHPWLREDGPPVVLAVGRLHPQKDYATLLTAFAELRRHREARLIILGEGEERSRLERLAVELGVAEHVSLPGFVSNPYAYMGRACLFVLSSRWEGLPTVLIEALALGARLVSTDCPSGPHEILQGGELGDLVPVGDPPALAAAMRRTLEEAAPVVDPRHWERYTWANAIEAYLDAAAVPR